MKFFELHISDYQRKTPHLSLAEHGAYMMMLQIFYGSERPLPVERRLLYRMLRAESRVERAAVDAVVKEFWIESPEGLTNARAIDTLNEYLEWVKSQREKGRNGARSRWHSSGHSSGDAIGYSGSHDFANGKTMASHSHSDLRPEDNPPTPLTGGLAASTRGRSGKSPERVLRDASKGAWIKSEIARKTGSFEQLQREDQIAAEAIRLIGGFNAIGMSTTDRLPQLRARFRETYEQLLERRRSGQQQ